jgi:hypothetical protein
VGDRLREPGRRSAGSQEALTQAGAARGLDCGRRGSQAVTPTFFAPRRVSDQQRTCPASRSRTLETGRTPSSASTWQANSTVQASVVAPDHGARRPGDGPNLLNHSAHPRRSSERGQWPTRGRPTGVSSPVRDGTAGAPRKTPIKMGCGCGPIAPRTSGKHPTQGSRIGAVVPARRLECSGWFPVFRRTCERSVTCGMRWKQ